jgi:type IV pilus biogenesis protein CpaD/CtpE
MSLQYKVLAVLLVLLATFAAGRYSVSQTPAVVATKQTEVQVVKQQAQHEVVVTVKEPDGEVKTTETIDTSVHTDTTKDQQTTQTVAPAKTSKINISALVANDFSRGGILPLYGVSASKEFIGPVTIGAFGLTNGTIGVSIGLNF